MAQQRRRSGTGSSKSSGAKRRSGSTRAKSSTTESKASSRQARAKRRAEKAPTRGTAPSGNISDLGLIEPSDEAKAAEPSDVDAMGQNKRREVIGHAYGPSRRSQLMVLGGVLAAFVIFVGGGKLLADKADEPPKSNPDAAPWSQANAPQVPAQRPQ